MLFLKEWLGFCCSVTKSCLTVCDPWTSAHKAPLSFIISWSLLKLISIESVIPSNHLIFCRLFLLLPSIFSSIRGFSNKSALCIRWPKYWSFSISLSSEYSGLISFRIDWVCSPCCPRDSQTLRLSYYHLSPLGPSLSTSLLPLTGPAHRTCCHSQDLHSVKGNRLIQGYNASLRPAHMQCLVNGVDTKVWPPRLHGNKSEQPAQPRAPMRPPEVSPAGCVATQPFPLPHSLSLTSSQISILQINLPTVHLHINLHFRICVPRN